MNSLSLRVRIYLSAVLMVFLMLGIGLVVFYGQASLNENVKRLRLSGETTARILTLDRDVQELRLRVDRYVASGQESLISDVNQIQARMKKTIDQLRTESRDLLTQQKTERMEVHLNEMAKLFETVVEERRLRREAVQVKLPEVGDRVDRRLRDFVGKIESAEVQTNRLRVYEARSDFSIAEKLILRYFETPDGRLVDAVLAATADAKGAIDAIDGFDDDKESLLSDFGLFEQIALRGVQATRSYLLFRNVVMAGEASEISHYSRLLREEAENQQQLIANQVESNKSRTDLLTMVSIAAAALLAVLVAGRLAVAMLPPITALTNTFQRLSAGETLIDIPGTERADEIGQMAVAARVFSDQNSRTNELLSDSERLRNKLETQAMQLKTINEELDGFAYVASHDLKSPLRGIRQLATWIEEDSVDRLSPQTSDYLAKLKGRVAKMETLLEDLLDFSRAGRMSSKPEDVNLERLLQSVVQFTDNASGVAVTWQENLPTLSVVRAPFEQVFLNLIGNAIKHNHRGKDGEVHVGFEPHGEFYQFCISDNGPGIAAKDHERAFQMYQRVGDQNIDGSGMGLAIVKKQIECFGGRIRLESLLGQGAAFTFTWPVHRQLA